MSYVGWFFFGVVVGCMVVTSASLRRLLRSIGGSSDEDVVELVKSHFQPNSIKDVSISERTFPFRMRADLQRSLDEIIGDGFTVQHFFGIRKEYTFGGISLTECLVESDHNRAVAMPPEYEELDIGEETSLRVLKNGLWLLQSDGVQIAVVLGPHGMHGEMTGMKVQVGTPNSPQGRHAADSVFRKLEQAVSKAVSYRGKILSLEQKEHSYSGESAGVAVHKLRLVEREQVILPKGTLELLERNVIQFVQQRDQLRERGMSTKKGILFYGPPGTGKTHTIHYLSRALPEHTTLLISAEQVGILSEYMSLARLLQPSIVVMEDVDLIARDRASMDSPCEEVLLNKLLNEMDGLKEEADILFILTTNRPETLEAALASRPGRIDQAIEFPLPDEVGRRKLVDLYSGNLKLDDNLVTEIVSRTEGVSASFIKELMRRTAQFAIMGNGSDKISHAHVDGALDEMLFQGGSLNLKILGAGEREEANA